MKNNILMIHLEGLSMLNYKYNSHLFPVLTSWEKKSLSFGNYYSTATSTLMVLSDIGYSGKGVFEKCQSINWRLDKEIRERSFLDYYIENGYLTRIVSFPSDEEAIRVMGKNGFVGHGIEVDQFMTQNDYHSLILKIFSSDKPFLLWACNFLSNIDFDGDVIDSDENGFLKWEKGYVSIDSEVEFLMKALEESGKLANTTVVFYGDHGDEVYTHGIHGGLTHAIEPYASLIHTPMFIYDERFEPESCFTLVSAKDLFIIINGIVELSERKTGFDEIGIPDNKYIYARNMFVGQRVREYSFGKAYSITDGVYLLMVSTRGLSMFELNTDPVCMHNILCYYDIGDGDIVLNRGLIGSIAHHFNSLMNERTFEDIRSVFLDLLPRLKAYVEDMYVGNNMGNRLIEMDFNSIDYPDDIKRVRFRESEEEYELFVKYFYEKRVILYGAGEYGKYCMEHVTKNGRLVAWVDSNFQDKASFDGYIIEAPEKINEVEYDIIYIAINNSLDRQDVYNSLINMGVDGASII